MRGALRAAAIAVGSVAILVGCGPAGLTAGSSPSAAASHSASTSTASSASPTPLPSPSDGPVATQAAPAALLLRLHLGSDVGDAHVLTVLGDGRAISTSTDQASRVERVLTPTGIQLLRDELRATGLTERSGRYMPVANPGVEPPGAGIGSNILEVALPGGEPVVINWYLYGDGPAGGSGDYYKPQPEAEALDALAARLGTLEDWLPPAGWAETQARPYAPTQYRIFIYGDPWGGSLDRLGPETKMVDWPLIDGVDVYGDVVDAVAHEKGDEGPYLRCRIVSVVEGASLIEALQAVGAPPTQGLLPGTALALGYRVNVRQVVINLEPILPFEDATCGSEPTF